MAVILEDYETWMINTVCNNDAKGFKLECYETFITWILYIMQSILIHNKEPS